LSSKFQVKNLGSKEEWKEGEREAQRKGDGEKDEGVFFLLRGVG
jgi:hypothetical protein